LQLKSVKIKRSRGPAARRVRARNGRVDDWRLSSEFFLTNGLHTMTHRGCL